MKVPPWSTSNRSTTAVSACTTCSIQMMETPPRRIVRISSTSGLHSCSVRPPATSSRRRTRGPVARARASSNRLRSRSVRLPAVRLALSASAHSSSSSTQRTGTVRSLWPVPTPGRHYEILEHAHAVERLRNLERSAQPQPTAPLRRQARNVAPLQHHASGVGLHGSARNPEQGALAGSVRTYDPERLTLRQREIDVVRHHHRAEALADFFEGEDRGIHDNSCNSPPTGMFGAVLFAVMTRSNLSALRCHCPATSGVLVTFFTGWPVHFTGPTIDP